MNRTNPAPNFERWMANQGHELDDHIIARCRSAYEAGAQSRDGLKEAAQGALIVITTLLHGPKWRFRRTTLAALQGSHDILINALEAEAALQEVGE